MKFFKQRFSIKFLLLIIFVVALLMRPMHLAITYVPWDPIGLMFWDLGTGIVYGFSLVGNLLFPFPFPELPMETGSLPKLSAVFGIAIGVIISIIPLLFGGIYLSLILAAEYQKCCKR